MITEAMVMKGLAYIGAWTVGTKVLLPVAEGTGNLIGTGFGKLMKTLNKKGKKTRKEEVDDQKKQAIIALLAECNGALDRNEMENSETTTIVINEVEPEPKFDQATMDWIRACQEKYGGFAKVDLN